MNTNKTQLQLLFVWTFPNPIRFFMEYSHQNCNPIPGTYDIIGKSYNNYFFYVSNIFLKIFKNVTKYFAKISPVLGPISLESNLIITVIPLGL